MNPALKLLVLVLGVLVAACASGPPRRVSEPAASIQQLTVLADGSWSVELRLQNYSSIPMQFGAIDLDLTVADASAGHLAGDAGIGIGPESADVLTLTHVPTSAARIAVADRLGGGGRLAYTLKGTVRATPEDGRPRSFDIERNSALSPVPGLPGVLR